jgi:hypothetical protein
MVKIYRVVWEDAQGGANVGWRELSELTQPKRNSGNNTKTEEKA